MDRRQILIILSLLMLLLLLLLPQPWTGIAEPILIQVIRWALQQAGVISQAIGTLITASVV